MRPIIQRLSAAGYSPWVPVSRLQEPVNIGLAVNLSSGAVLTYSVQYTMDNPNYKDSNASTPENLTTQFTMSRTGTSLTIGKTNHGLSVGDWAQSWGNGGAPLDDEWRSVASITDANNFVVTVVNSGLTAPSTNGTGWLQTARVFNHASLVGLSASGSGNISAPVVAVRFGVTAYTSGFADFTVIQGRA